MSARARVAVWAVGEVAAGMCVEMDGWGVEGGVWADTLVCVCARRVPRVHVFIFFFFFFCRRRRMYEKLGGEPRRHRGSQLMLVCVCCLRHAVTD